MGSGKGNAKRTNVKLHGSAAYWPSEDIHAQKQRFLDCPYDFYVDTKKLPFLSSYKSSYPIFEHYLKKDDLNDYSVSEIEYILTEYVRDIISHKALEIKDATDEELNTILIPLSSIDIDKLEIELFPTLLDANYIPVTLLYNNQPMAAKKFKIYPKGEDTSFELGARQTLSKTPACSTLLVILINMSLEVSIPN